MITKKTAVFLSSIIFIFCVIVAIRLIFFRKSDVLKPKVVTPAASQDMSDAVQDSALGDDSAVLTTFVPLLSTESLITALTFDFDGDSLDDQVVAVFRAGSSNIFLIVGLYNGETNTYERSAEIATEISRVRTFSLDAVDVIGNHKNALVYQGVNAAGDSVMKIFLCSKNGRTAKLETIGDFSSDGSIFILQAERSEAYELSQAKGASYTVWIYSSDKSENADSATANVSQIQTEYTWNETERRYTQNRQLKVTGSRLAARELARIQNGNVDTFARFLDGLWYKTTSTASEPLYICFDYAEKEVIFLSDDTEGVYSLEDSSLRRSGIYMTAVNSIIPSMKRRFDIMLTGVNEVYVHVHDDVRMVIKESNQWDGTYKKMSFQSTFGESKTVQKDAEYEKALQETVWKNDDGAEFSFAKNMYNIKGAAFTEDGMYVMSTIGNFAVIQFRSAQNPSAVQSAYSVAFKVNEETIPAKRRGQKPTVRRTEDKNTIILKPVRLSPNTVFAAEGRTLVLTRG